VVGGKGVTILNPGRKNRGQRTKQNLPRNRDFHGQGRAVAPKESSGYFRQATMTGRGHLLSKVQSRTATAGTTLREVRGINQD